MTMKLRPGMTKWINKKKCSYLSFASRETFSPEVFVFIVNKVIFFYVYTQQSFPTKDNI